MVADAPVFFDSPEKTAGPLAADALGSTPLLLPSTRLLDNASTRVTIVSPCFLPSDAGVQRLRQARVRGVDVQLISNSLADSGEPLVSLGYGLRRPAMLQAGVRLFELSPLRLHRADVLRQALGRSVGRLHAKLGFIDDRLLLVGPMNLDPRSASTTTGLAWRLTAPRCCGRCWCSSSRPMPMRCLRCAWPPTGRHWKRANHTPAGRWHTQSGWYRHAEQTDQSFMILSITS